MGRMGTLKLKTHTSCCGLWRVYYTLYYIVGTCSTEADDA